MHRPKLFIFIGLVLALVALSWGVDQSSAQQGPKKGNPPPESEGYSNLNEAQEHAAANRAALGMMQNITNSQKWEAAKGNAARRAEALKGITFLRKGKEGAKNE